MCYNLLKNIDSGQLNCVVFLDVRKASDFINHEILIDKMRNSFGVTGNQLRWFESYLNNRVQRTTIESKNYMWNSTGVYPWSTIIRIIHK